MIENKIKHLEFIQGVVNRLSTNSFLLKGWSVVLVSALFALSASQNNHKFIALSFFPAIVFWGLDGYFLWQERLFRALYDHVRALPDDQIDFSMNISTVRKSVAIWIVVVFSKTLFVFHGVLLAAIVLVAFFSF
ncbi:MAG: hypothetical protein OEU92_27105 [Alphaproteobacteria bacterium]|nr:hypothetical protein [Alphaproteobacteria bacterium]